MFFFCKLGRVKMHINPRQRPNSAAESSCKPSLSPSGLENLIGVSSSGRILPWIHSVYDVGNFCALQQGCKEMLRYYVFRVLSTECVYRQQPHHAYINLIQESTPLQAECVRVGLFCHKTLPAAWWDICAVFAGRCLWLAVAQNATSPDANPP